MRKFQQLRKFVLALSGAQEEVLELVPSERTRFESLGWAILITSCMAVISMWFALSSALGINGVLALPVALFWGLVIMGIDRWLITSMPVEGGRKFAMAVPRVVLALLLGTLISTPLVLRIFQSEINAQIAVMQQSNYNSFLIQQQSSQVDKQVVTYGNEVKQLDTVINSRGAQTGNTASDPELVAYKDQLTQLEAQLDHWTTLKATYYNDYICQMYGGSQCPKRGDGPAAQASYKSYQQAVAQVTSYQDQISQVQGEIQQRDQLLSSESKSSQEQRYEQALTQLPQVQAEYNTALQRQNQLQASYYAQEQAAHGILMRLEALSQLSSGSTTVAGARLLLFLLFLVIECLPVTVKLLQRPGEYEAAVQEAKQAERRYFKKAFASSFRPGLRPAVVQLRPEYEPAAEPIWNRTKVLPPLAAGESEDARPTDIFDDAGRDGGPTGQAGQAGSAVQAPPVIPPRAARRWRGADAYRNFWSERDADDYPPQQAAEADQQDTDAYGPPTRLDAQPTRLDGQASPSPTSLDPWGAQADPPGATRVDYGPADGLRDGGFYNPREAVPAADGHDAWTGYRREEEDEPARSRAARDAAAARDGAAAQADGNGHGIPLNWDDE